jgi:MYXO-CTERM domain-containing protein
LGTTVWEGAFEGVTENALIVYNCGAPEIQIYDIAAGEWRAPITGLEGTSTYHCAAEHSVAHGVTIFGGGNDNPTSVWRLDADRSVTRLADAPFAYSGYIEAGVVAEPLTGDFLFFGDGQVWVLDPTGSGTWTRSADIPGGIPGPGGDNEEALLAPLPRHGVVMYVGCDTACRVWLYRHAPGAVPPPPFDGGVSIDGGAAEDGGPPGPVDAGAGSDAGEPEVGGGCGCSVAKRSRPTGAALLAPLLVLLLLRRRPYPPHFRATVRSLHRTSLTVPGVRRR